MKSKFLRLKQVLELTGLSRTTLWRLERKGKFPKHVQITARLIVWNEQEIYAWVDQMTASEREVENA